MTKSVIAPVRRNMDISDRTIIHEQSDAAVDNKLKPANTDVPLSSLDATKMSELQSEMYELKQMLRDRDRVIDELKETLSTGDEIRDVSTIVDQILQHLKDLSTDTRDYVADLLVAAVANILGKSLVSPEQAMAVVKQVLASSDSDSILKVQVSERDYNLIKKYSEQLSQLPLDLIEPSKRISIGGCYIYTPTGLLDGTVETQLTSLRRQSRDWR